eukprot:TRINITY_DN7536_c0_g1_i1.p1 TRINITY_DN7536_c0_g1~~TRINITY_DN7536_c0_g1_i1.p1  ORF type:complete len:182 (-),score=19.51 TRINITY_DN7536_c0_g1_i1:341-886(-)
METEDYGVIKFLHDVPELLDSTVALLNAEWPRKGSYWQNSASKSSENLPLIIVSVKIDRVVSQLRLSRVSDDDHGLLVENVVVDKSLRGKGYGRFIMNAAESWAVQHGFTAMYLSTPDMQAFYGRLGYVEGDPVTSLGDNASKLNKAQLQGLLAAFGGNAGAATKDKTWMRKNLTPYPKDP